MRTSIILLDTMPLTKQTILAISVAALVTSLVYLGCELTFHARLVDLLGSNPTKEEIDYAERVGRLLTGLALTLAVLPWVLTRLAARLLHISRTAFFIAAIVAAMGLTVLSVTGARIGIEWFVQTLTERHTPDERRQAVLSLFIVSHLHSRQDGQPTLTLNGKDAPAHLRETVPGRLVLAALPFLLANIGDLEQRTRQQMRAILAGDLESKLGRSEKLYNEVYVKGMDSLVLAFQSYQTATSTYAVHMRNLERDAYSDWEDYTDELSRNRLTPARVKSSPALGLKVSERLRQRDPSIPLNWLPSSAEDFRVLRAGRLQKAYEETLLKLGFRDPARVPRFESFTHFLQHPDIQAAWCNSLKSVDARLHESLCSFGPREGESKGLFPIFEKEVFAPLVERNIDELAGRYSGPAEAYGDGGSLAKDGYDAMKTVLVIPVALFFSLMGGLAHVVKCAYLIGMAVFAPWYMRLVIPLCLSLTIVAVTMASLLPMQDDAFVVVTRQAMHDKYGGVILGLAEGAMKLEPVVYPIGKAIPLAVPVSGKAAD